LSFKIALKVEKSKKEKYFLKYYIAN